MSFELLSAAFVEDNFCGSHQVNVAATGGMGDTIILLNALGPSKV
jgi:hypothetical protein